MSVSEIEIVVCVLQFLTLACGMGAFKHLSDALLKSREVLKESPKLSFPDLGKLKEEIAEIMEDIVHDTLQTLQPPRAVDHVFGAVAQLIQARTMKMMDAAPVIAETAAQIMSEQENV